MIIKILSNKGFSAFDYNSQKIEKGQAELTDIQNLPPVLVAGTGKLSAAQIHSILEYQDSLRSDSKSTQIHIVISAHKRDDDKERLTACAKEYMEKMGYGNQPYAVYFHKDTDNNHVHIVSTRVKLDRTIITDSLEKKRSAQICWEFNHRYGHSLADTVQQQFRLDCQQALTWAFADEKSFAGLMETYGYKSHDIKPGSKTIVFIRDGSICGKVTREQLLPSMERYADGVSFRKNKDFEPARRSPIFTRKQLIYKKMSDYNKKGFTLREVEKMEEFRKKLGLKLHVIPRKDSQGNRHIAWMCQDFIGKTFYKGSDIMNLNGFSLQPDTEVKKELFTIVAPELMLDSDQAPLPWRQARHNLSQAGYELIMYKGQARVRVMGTNDLYDIPRELSKSMMRAQRVADIRQLPIHSIAEARVLAMLNFVTFKDIVPEQYVPVDTDARTEAAGIIGSIFTNQADQIATSLKEEQIAVIVSGENCFFLDQKKTMLFSADEIGIPLTLDDIRQNNIKFVSMDYLSANYIKWTQIGDDADNQQLQEESRVLSSRVPNNPDDRDENYRSGAHHGTEPISEDKTSPIGDARTRISHSVGLFDVLLEITMGFAHNLESYQQGATNSKKDKKKRDRDER